MELEKEYYEEEYAEFDESDFGYDNDEEEDWDDEYED